jgi:hypothetical protein
MYPEVAQNSARIVDLVGQRHFESSLAEIETPHLPARHQTSQQHQIPPKNPQPQQHQTQAPPDIRLTRLQT